MACFRDLATDLRSNIAFVQRFRRQTRHFKDSYLRRADTRLQHRDDGMVEADVIVHKPEGFASCRTCADLLLKLPEELCKNSRASAVYTPYFSKLSALLNSSESAEKLPAEFMASFSSSLSLSLSANPTQSISDCWGWAQEFVDTVVLAPVSFQNTLLSLIRNSMSDICDRAQLHSSPQTLSLVTLLVGLLRVRCKNCVIGSLDIINAIQFSSPPKLQFFITFARLMFDILSTFSIDIVVFDGNCEDAVFSQPCGKSTYRIPLQFAQRIRFFISRHEYFHPSYFVYIENRQWATDT